MKQIPIIAALILSVSSMAQTSVRTMALDYPKSTLTKLQSGDTITIQCHSMGCFNSSKSKLIITKQADGFEAQLYKISETYDAKTEKMTRHPDSLLQIATLTEQNLKDFAQFEHELKNAREGNCTTIDKYEVKSKYLNIEKTDGSCQWNGFYNLTRSFFGK